MVPVDCAFIAITQTMRLMHKISFFMVFATKCRCNLAHRARSSKDTFQYGDSRISTSLCNTISRLESCFILWLQFEQGGSGISHPSSGSSVKNMLNLFHSFIVILYPPSVSQPGNKSFLVLADFLHQCSPF